MPNKVTRNFIKMNKRGKPKIDDSERIRRLMWFHSVMSKTTLSLYELDVKFDIKYDELVTDKLRADKRRRKIFEDLRDRYILPFKNDLDVFLDQVENTDGFENTAKFYRSYFWQLTQPKPLEINQLRSIIFQIFQSYSLFEKEIKTSKQKVSISNQNSEYINGLITLLKDITFSLDKLALIVALFREAYLVGNVSLADEIFSIYQLYVELITESDDIHVSLKDDFLGFVQVDCFLSIWKNYLRIGLNTM